MIELLLAAIPVALAYAYRIGHDHGRLGRRIVQIGLDDGQALLVNRRTFDLMEIPRPRMQGRRYAEDRADAMLMGLDYLFTTPKPYVDTGVVS